MHSTIAKFKEVLPGKIDDWTEVAMNEGSQIS